YMLFDLLVLCFFFFQAEDGIRDATVTGVQTCALPISHQRRGNLHGHSAIHQQFAFVVERLKQARIGATGADRQRDIAAAMEEDRSEERRVGKEGRSRRATAQETETEEVSGRK